MCQNKGRHQNSLPLTTIFLQKLTQPSKGISYPVGDLCRRFTKLTCPLPIHYLVIWYPKQMVQMAFCDLSHTYHKQVTNVSPACFCHPTVGNFDVSPKQQNLWYWDFLILLQQDPTSGAPPPAAGGTLRGIREGEGTPLVASLPHSCIVEAINRTPRNRPGSGSGSTYSVLFIGTLRVRM